MTVWVYARVSTRDQNPQFRLDALVAGLQMAWSTGSGAKVLRDLSGVRDERHGMIIPWRMWSSSIWTAP